MKRLQIYKRLGRDEAERRATMGRLLQARGRNLSDLGESMQEKSSAQWVRDVWADAERVARQTLRQAGTPTGGDEHWHYWMDDFDEDLALELAVAVGQHGLSWCAPGVDPFEFGTGPEWIERIEGAAMILAPYISEFPPGALIFEHALFTIVLVRADTTVAAWVGARGFGVAVQFDTRSLATVGRQSEPTFWTAAGCAIAWYIDCSIRRPSSSPSLPMMLESSIESALAQLWRPSPQFDRFVSQLRRGERETAFAHWVVSHIRHLTTQWPDPQHVAEAPQYLRQYMGPDDTWVRGHVRNPSNVDGLLSHLRTHSMLANALGTAAWRY